MFFFFYIIIEIQGISKVYGDNTVLDNLSLNIRKNELLTSANSRLLSQIPMEKEESKEQEKKEESKPKEFTLKDLFDSKGHFKK